ncbi:MAG TPA: YraN family protein [Vicinamibacteria bacterium]|nr:YraN family protein [Vicinamibacteria bacterium]
MAPKALTGLLHRLRGPAAGAEGEDQACRHLCAQGFDILARNFRCRSGEVDVIARDGAVTVFVEVKHRRGARHGAGYESVTFGKRRRIVRAARLYAASRGLGEAPVRFDVISIDEVDGRPHLRHDRGAFDADGA